MGDKIVIELPDGRKEEISREVYYTIAARVKLEEIQESIKRMAQKPDKILKELDALVGNQEKKESGDLEDYDRSA